MFILLFELLQLQGFYDSVWVLWKDALCPPYLVPAPTHPRPQSFPEKSKGSSLVIKSHDQPAGLCVEALGPHGTSLALCGQGVGRAGATRGTWPRRGVLRLSPGSERGATHLPVRGGFRAPGEGPGGTEGPLPCSPASCLCIWVSVCISFFIHEDAALLDHQSSPAGHSQR